MKLIATKKTTVDVMQKDGTLSSVMRNGDSLEFNFDDFEPITYNDIEELRDWCEEVLEKHSQELMKESIIERQELLKKLEKE